jgi:hypothetical protein
LRRKDSLDLWKRLNVGRIHTPKVLNFYDAKRIVEQRTLGLDGIGFSDSVIKEMVSHIENPLELLGLAWRCLATKKTINLKNVRGEV